MARKNYPDDFKGDAVALYRDTEGATHPATQAPGPGRRHPRMSKTWFIDRRANRYVILTDTGLTSTTT